MESGPSSRYRFDTIASDCLGLLHRRIVRRRLTLQIALIKVQGNAVESKQESDQSCIPAAGLRHAVIATTGQEPSPRTIDAKRTTVGYIISFFLGIFVATQGVSGVAQAMDVAVIKTQQYIRENSK